MMSVRDIMHLCIQVKLDGGPLHACYSLPASAHLIDMAQQIRRILVDADGAGLAQFVGAVAATQEADAERAAARGGEHVPDAVSDHDGTLDPPSQAILSGEKQVRIGFCVAHVVARDD